MPRPEPKVDQPSTSGRLEEPPLEEPPLEEFLVPQESIPASLHPIRFDDLDPDAVHVIEVLESEGFEAYLVGGCVRDLLLGIKPKDFDIATDASPYDVRRQFRRARVIGRRFRLAHVVFPRPRSSPGPHKIIEVSTFRRSPSESSINDGLIVRDNEFGTLKEDALRRDFTVNSLFYDVKREEVIDHAGGLKDLEKRRLKTIGEPDRRLREDPVRMLRAIKFASRLNLEIGPELWDSMLAHRETLEMSAPPRILEELIRILASGSAKKAFDLLIESEILGVLLPDFSDYLETAEKEGCPDRVENLLARLEAVDRHLRGQRRFSPSHYLGILLVGPVLELVLRTPTVPSESDPSESGPTKSAMEENDGPKPQPIHGDELRREIDFWLEPFSRDCRLPKRESSLLRESLMAQRDFFGARRRKGGFSIRRFTSSSRYSTAYRLFCLACEAHGLQRAQEKWDARVRSALSHEDQEASGESSSPPGGSSRPRKRKRRRRPSGPPRDQEPNAPRADLDDGSNS